MSKINPRFLWALSLLEITGSDTILEIGCGSGVLTALVAHQLRTGTITGIDRSATLITKAETTYAGLISEQKAIFQKAAFLEFNSLTKRYQKIVAFNVPFFWKDASNEIALIKKLLLPGGKLFVFHQAPYNINIGNAQPLISALKNAGFTVSKTELNSSLSPSAVCIVAQIE